MSILNLVRGIGTITRKMMSETSDKRKISNRLIDDYLWVCINCGFKSYALQDNCKCPEIYKEIRI
jgi:rubrerythrin